MANHQILGVTMIDAALTADDLRRGIRVTIPGQANTPRTRIKARERVSGQAQLPGAQAEQALALQSDEGNHLCYFRKAMRS